MSENVDVAIIGAGSAGLAALREVRKRTDRFVLINDGPWGTTCARVGCMPSKVLIEAANAFHRRHDFDRFGIRGAASLAVDIPAVLERVRELRDEFVGGTLKATDGLGDHAIAGRARLRGPNRIDVEGRSISARSIVIATGSRPMVPASWHAFGERILTTDTLFEQHDLPQRIAVIGMGAIGVEMAQALARLGVDVIGFGSSRSLAGLSDPVITETLESLLREEFAIHLGSSAEIVPEGNALRVHNGKVSVVVDAVLAAMGRRPNIDGLGLETLGVALDQRGMPPVDPHTTRIGDLPVFFAGDANGYAPVLHEAADEGHIAGLNAVSHSPRCFTRRTPIAIVFSAPNIAVVGKRHSELDEAATIVGAVSFERQGRARAALRDKGVLRIYADRHSGALLGAEMCAPAGEHMAHLLALAIGRSLTVHDLLRLPFYHPVLEEGMRSALRELAAQLPKCSDSDLASCTDFGVEALD
jgi:dihydrolipoamide dehydrogenase